MKKTILAIFLFLITYGVHAQILLGGGSNGGGGGGTPAGPTSSVQLNGGSGLFAGSANLTGDSSGNLNSAGTGIFADGVFAGVAPPPIGSLTYAFAGTYNTPDVVGFVLSDAGCSSTAGAEAILANDTGIEGSLDFGVNSSCAGGPGAEGPNVAYVIAANNLTNLYIGNESTGTSPNFTHTGFVLTTNDTPDLDSSAQWVNDIAFPKMTAGGMLKLLPTTGELTFASPGTDYLTPTGSGAGLTGITLAQIAAGTAPTSSGTYNFANNPITIGPLGTAVSGTNFNSNGINFTSSFWNGTAAQSDTWLCNNVLGAGTNPTSSLHCSHTGSTGFNDFEANNITATGAGTLAGAFVNANNGGGGGGFLYNGTAPSGHCLIGNGTAYVDSSSCGGGGYTPPTGTGFPHITSGAQDPAAVGETGTGNVVRATSPTLVTPALGTPSAAVLTNATGLPFSSLASATNTAAAMVVGAGASLGFTSTGTINASTLGGIGLTGTGTAIPTVVTPVPANHVAAFIGGNIGDAGFTTFQVASTAVANTFAAAQTAPEWKNTVTTVTPSATPALLATNGMQTITLNANSTPTITGIAAGQHITFQICQPASGGPYTWTWPASIHGGMTIGTTTNTCSQQEFASWSGSTLLATDTGTQNLAP